MSGEDDEGARKGEYASPPCFMHELDPASAGITPPQQHADVMRWRKGERERLIADRLSCSAEERARWGEAIAASLDALLPDISGRIVSLYWPFRGEPDLRGWMERAHARGAICALPVVVEKKAPLIFREWQPRCRLERGVWNIPIPADGQEVVPDIVIAPVVGFDPQCYRLGYGGGFYDRTLASLGRRPQIMGVGYSSARIATIYPQPHDVPMDRVITGAGVSFPSGDALRNI
jgi:5-formyltetrahydrofolate cyclo-ligase